MQITEIPVIELNVKKGTSPELPKEVEVGLENGLKAKFPVEWGNITPESTEAHGKLRVTTYPNPIIEQRADPYLYKHTDGYYYFTGSYPLYDRIVLRRAKSITELPDAEEVVIWEAHESGIMSEHI